MIHVYEELGEVSRRQILGQLMSGPKNVSSIVQATGLKQPNVSNHLARMRGKGVISAAKSGREVFYTFANSEIEAIVSAAIASHEDEDTPFDVAEAAKAYAKASIRGDEIACLEIVEKAFRAQIPLIDLYHDLLIPATRHVETWLGVEAIDTAQDQMSAAVTERILARVVQLSGPVKKLNRTALLGCPPNCWHTLGIRMLTDYLQISGWKTMFLGPNVPHPCFLNTVAHARPDMVLLSCKSENGLPCSLKLVKALNELRKGDVSFVIGVGGCSAVANREEVLAAGADFVSPDLKTFANEFLPVIEKTGKAPR